MAGKKQCFNFTQYNFTKTKNAYIPKTVYVSMNQYGANKCSPTIESGQIVKEGQVIGRGKGDNASIHSPVPGIVSGFSYLSMPYGKRSLAAVITMNGAFSFTGKTESISDWNLLSTTELITLFKNRGIINTFYTKPVSLAAQCVDTVHTDKVLYVCLFDKQPDIFVDSFIANNYTKKIIVGAEIVAKALSATKIVFFYSIERGKITPRRFKKFLSASANAEFVQIDTTRYPRTVNSELRKAINKKFPDKKTEGSIEYNSFCIDCTTLYDVYNGIVLSKPLMERLVQVTGTGLYRPRLLKVRIGTPIQNIVYECGGSKKAPGKIIVNGLIQGIAISDITSPVTKFVKSITLLQKKELQFSSSSACIHCGRCHNVCPSGIHPASLFASYVNNIKIPKEIHVTINWCSECGLCNTVCPSRLPLVQTISLMKEEENERCI
ncbi:MAG TPA: 4Fe-4S dicluster domain-containing protein [Treponemataceae bacterium]|nr:4Fe-4S dicluster domain-containing protein [Treponemataceae bacterium]